LSIIEISDKMWPSAEEAKQTTIDNNLQPELEDKERVILKQVGQFPAALLESFDKPNKIKKSTAKVASFREPPFSSFSDLNFINKKKQVTDKKFTSLLDESGLFNLSFSKLNSPSVRSYRLTKDLTPEPIVFTAPEKCYEMNRFLEAFRKYTVCGLSVVRQEDARARQTNQSGG